MTWRAERLNVNEVGVGGEINSGNAIFEVNGGTVIDTGYVVVSRAGAAETGFINVYSGTFLFQTVNGGGLDCNWGAGQTSIVNVLGGLFEHQHQRTH